MTASSDLTWEQEARQLIRDRPVQTINMAAGNYASTMRGLATATAAYTTAGATMNWSDEDRKRAAGK